MSVIRRVVATVVVAVVVACSSATPSPTPPTARATPTAASTATPATPAPTSVACSNRGGGSCLGPLAAGTYATTDFERQITYTVPDGWQNLEDLPGNFLLLPPWATIQGVDAGTTDYVGVGLRNSAASRDCTSEELAARPEPGVAERPAAIVAELAARPGLIVTPPREATVGGLDGLVIDVEIDPSWTGTCFWSKGQPAVPLIHGLAPSSFDHAMLAGFTTRLYFLDHEQGTLGIEIQIVDPSRRDQLVGVAEGLSFADLRPETSVLVGSWLGYHDCRRIVDMLHAADLDQQIALNVVEGALIPGVSDPAMLDLTNPCKDAVAQRHSHFFTATGMFGSRDMDGQQVDDNAWSIVDEHTFAIGDTPFRYAISGDELRMEPVSVGTCPPDPMTWCPEAWKLMVAMPGMAWLREP